MWILVRSSVYVGLFSETGLPKYLNICVRLYTCDNFLLLIYIVFEMIFYISTRFYCIAAQRANFIRMILQGEHRQLLTLTADKKRRKLLLL